MDPTLFDNLTRSLAQSPSRRSVTRLFAVLAMGGIATGDWIGEVAARRKGKKSNGKKRKKRKGKKVKKRRGCQDGRVKCDGKCIDTNVNPLHCGGCGNRCQVNARCEAGQCTCVRGICAVNDSVCCPLDSPRVEICRCSSATDPTTCETAGRLELCPAGTVPCRGPRCGSCCPAGSTCDPTTGTCIQ
jgi:hypothetical protein